MGHLDIQWAWKRRHSTLVILSLFLSPFAYSQQQAPGAPKSPPAQTIVLPKSVPDPIEPFNRAMWAFNKGLLTGVIKPTARVYRAVVIKPIRTGIGNFGTNLTYPARLLDNLLQARWAGARDESYRFLCNTTVGIGGFFDVADKWKIPRSDADFGQTLAKWGWQPHFFLMLPIFGPSNDRDAVGLAVDTAANPLIYISPYNLVASDPLTYLGPYTYFTYVVTYNNMADTVNEDVRFMQAEMDPYAELEYAWTFVRANRVANFQVKGKQDEAALETLESVFFTYKNPNFPNLAKTRSVLIPSTGRRLKFTFWLQPDPAPVVYIIPGLGSHRLAETSMALAELVYSNGYSAVTVSSPFNSEFMEHASTAALPAYLPVDGDDMHVALTEIDHRLNVLYPNRLGPKALMGYSMGAFESLYIASTQSTNQSSLIKFDRYLAIDTPVRLLHGMGKLDQFYQAPLRWPAAERTNDMENTFLKVADLSKRTMTPRATLPFSDIESEFLIGVDFRFILRDIIYSSQRRYNEHVLRRPLWRVRRDPVYEEIMKYSYDDYFSKFAVPYYKAWGIASGTAAALDHAGDLRTYETGIRANPGIRVIVNDNDFLLTDQDRHWLHATFTPDQLTVFPKGGHLGNLFNPNVQKTILEDLSELKPPSKRNEPLKVAPSTNAPAGTKPILAP
ncbi:MAG TPA: VacJ family lipoprotein [Verrucomicrobiae bacterium]|jgi:ABC-type transporter lipoprotein component MlaA|nr:VacJ family lipoprotein [Verrucomicrobiae bacterium]